MTASSEASGDSVYVCATTQLTPAAAMSGVVPAGVAKFGSAPCSSRSRMTVVSPDSAARRNGVWPVKSTHDTSPSEYSQRRLGGTSRVCALTSAPCSMSAVINPKNGSRSTLLVVGLS